jgi:hypothetical protein
MAKIEIRIVDWQHKVLIFFATFLIKQKSREAGNYFMVRNLS